QDHTLSTVQEEYQTSVENYEFQLRTMSEHLAELNEKLAAQREEIDLLKYQQQQQQQPSGKTSSGMAKVSSSRAPLGYHVVGTECVQSAFKVAQFTAFL